MKIILDGLDRSGKSTASLFISKYYNIPNLGNLSKSKFRNEFTEFNVEQQNIYIQGITDAYLDIFYNMDSFVKDRGIVSTCVYEHLRNLENNDPVLTVDLTNSLEEYLSSISKNCNIKDFVFITLVCNYGTYVSRCLKTNETPVTEYYFNLERSLFSLCNDYLYTQSKYNTIFVNTSFLCIEDVNEHLVSLLESRLLK